MIFFLNIKTDDCDNCIYNLASNQCIRKEDSNVNCNGCKPHLGNNNKCYNCNDISNFYIINNDQCIPANDGCENKIVYETKECVGHCSDDTYEMGDYCYLKCDDDIKKPNDQLKICECKYKYFIDKENELNNKKKIECLDDNIVCEYYDSDTHECHNNIDGCGNKKTKENKEYTTENNQNQDKYHFRCSNECKRGEYTYEKDNKLYCDDNCTNGQYYYNNSLSGINYCVDSCENEEFYDNNECTNQCKNSNAKIKIDLSNKEKIMCSNEVDLPGYFKYENNYYLKDCSDTQNLKLFNNRITYNNIEIGNDDGNIIYKCEDICPNGKYILEGTNNCTDCKGNYYYEKKCLSNCNNINIEYYIIKKDQNTDNNHDPFECINNCPVGYYKDIVNKICYEGGCPNTAYTTNNFECIYECNNITNPSSVDINEGYILETGDKKYCYSSCFISGQNWYHINNDNKCFENNCKSKNLYSAYDNPYICYSSCDQIGNEYLYEKDNICYKSLVTCDNYYFYVNNVIQCANYNDCLGKFKYIKGKECTDDCDSNYYKIEQILDNNKIAQNIGACLLDPKDCLKEGYDFYNHTDKTCRKECDAYKILSAEGKPIENQNGDTCFSSCPSNYPYKNLEKGECLKKCENFFYGYDCYDDCNEIQKTQKYYFKDTKECIDDCKIGNKYYYIIKDSTDKICYYSCPTEYPFVESVSDNQIEPYKCIQECRGTKSYYYEDKKICRESCDILYKSENDKICVLQCAPGQKVYNNKYCRDSCPKDTYIAKVQLSETNSLIVEKCVNKCPNEYPLISNSTNNCLKQCTLSENYKYDGICYEKCPKDTYSDDYEKICYKDKCPSDFKYFEIDENGIKHCKISCPSDKFYLLEGGECRDECPGEYKYIGFNKICLKECSGNYGEYYEKKSGVENYNCLNICGEKYTVYDTKECVSECDSDKYYTSPNLFCYEKCNVDKDYPFSTIDENNKKVCGKKCFDSQPNFGVDKICQNGCEELITDYDGSCVSQCNNVYYKYLDIESNKCINECKSPKYITKDNKCVSKCESPYNYIEGNECRTKCDSNHFSQEIDDTKIYNCLTKCDNDKFYYENNKKCLSECDIDDFVIQDTNICTFICPSNYKSYFSDKSETSSYTQNTCVLNCPNDKPYTFNDKCVKECPTNKKYYIENEKICLLECPKNWKIDQNNCTNICPEEKKFLDNNNKCVDNCPDKFKYYIDGIYKCLSTCEQKYYIEGYKCVTFCSDENPYLTGRECSNKCPNNNNFVVKNFTHGEIDIQRKCLAQCPSNYTYIENYNYNEIQINFCIDKCDYKILNDNKCLTKCDGDNKYYDYENGICLNKCPDSKKFYENNENNENILCYKKCPSNKPFFVSSSFECTDSCNIINITNKECLTECNKKKFVDNDITYCLNDCEELGLFQLGVNECVKDCSSIDGINSNNLIANMATKTCDCQNLFYYDNNQIKCISEDNCSGTYKYRLFGTNQCLSNCKDKENYILSFDEKYCLSSEDFCPINTKKTEYNEDNANYKCDCKYKYYIDGSIKICLNENEECPSNYNWLGDNNECKNECPGDNYIQIGNVCINNFDNNCNNNDYYYIDDDGKYKCISETECINRHFFLIENLKQCVKNCNMNEYNIYSNITGKSECLSSCNSITNTIVKRVENSEKSIYECVCIDLWYKDDYNIIHCNTGENIINCENFNINKNELIYETKECVNGCNSLYPYLFDGECFKTCEDVKRNYGFDVEIIGKECKCKKNLWKKIDNKKVCINNNFCYEANYQLLIYDTYECISECPTGYNIIFNHTCYKNCPDNTIDDNNSCKCKYKWYKYNDNSLNVEDIIICFEKESDDCPKDFYPYLDASNNQCVEDTSKCSGPIIFNYSCYSECPPKTINTPDLRTCQCDKNEGVWYQYTFEGKMLYKCGLSECPKDKHYLDYDTKECIYTCGNKYHFEGICYSKCPENTKSVDEISKECAETFTFNDPEDLKSLEENVKNNIINIYNKTSSGGLVFNINNSTMQIYGVNKKKSENKDLIMRTNLTYIDLSNCIDKIYEKNGITDDTDIIIVKYDIGDVTNSSTINPVEYKIVNSKTGKEIPLDACEDNSIIISYPLSTILSNFVSENKNLRNLEDNNDKNLNLNLREQFLKGKELNSLDDQIDSFNIDNKLYNDICYKCKINGKDLILEDRFNYLYPLYSFCESNCVFGKTDFILERVSCNCTPKDGVNFERNFELLNNNVNVKTVKDKQKGSILKCLSKVSGISKNFGFFYGLIILLVEIGLAILTILFSYKVFMMRIKNKFDINGDDKIHNIETENIENIENINLSSDKKYKKNNKNEEMIKTSERNLENPPKKNKKIKINIGEDKKEDSKKPEEEKKEKSGDPEVINIKNIKINKKKQHNYQNTDEKLSSSKSEHSYTEKSSVVSFKEMEDENIFDLIKLEKTLLTVDYEHAINKNKAEILIMILTEILDKIYIIKAIWFLQKYEIFSLYFSLYLLWHMLILSFLSLFYNNSNLHKIWITDNYPNLNYHLSFGFLSCLISFIFYRGLYYLINNDKKINEIELIEKEKKDEIGQKYKNMMFWAQIKIIIFYAIQFILTILFFLYLIAFCGIYNVTSSKLAESYGIALIEVIIIKILYGIVLGILRKISLVHRINILYKIVRFLDLYIA